MRTAMARIRAISLDFYNTVVRFEPMREQIQAAACAEFGISIDARAIVRAIPPPTSSSHRRTENFP